MRFVAEGPSIPNELLLARDQGRVVFFCGSGVSKARSALPDFFGLANKVIEELGVAKDSVVWRMMQEAQKIEARIGVPGVISADRIFSLLERDFSQNAIERAVALALRPAMDCDVSAHQILVDLATTADGSIRLITTNFDRLFEKNNEDVKIWQHPRLPLPSYASEMNGLVYLHGRCTENYDAAEGNGFVLSSSEFGRAYLSEGWATSFIREILERYVVVFIGYSADDPPVQYLLEALSKVSGNARNAYAFQSGDPNDATARWAHKGVQAIWYSPENGHRALWETLQCWAERARNPQLWYENVIARAVAGPENLAPFERGQIASIISTVEGAKYFYMHKSAPAAEWLCVFDPACRFSKPGYTGNFLERGDFVDPFDLYGLDFDMAPQKTMPGEGYVKRDVPADAWDGLALSRLDRNNLKEDNFSALRGFYAGHLPRIVPRLANIFAWIAKVSNQPSAVWWAARQSFIHPDLCRQIRWSIEQSEVEYSEVIRSAWALLFDIWEGQPFDRERELYKLSATVQKFGWDSVTVRQYIRLREPHLIIEANYWSPIPPSEVQQLRFEQLFALKVAYPPPPGELEVPTRWLDLFTKSFRLHLESAVALEREYNIFHFYEIPSLHSKSSGELDRRIDGSAGLLREFVSIYQRLVEVDIDAASHELSNWSKLDKKISTPLLIWVASNHSLVGESLFRKLILELESSDFWDNLYQSDLLVTIASRWSGLTEIIRSELEAKILVGPPRLDNEGDVTYTQRRAYVILTRLHWLAAKNCIFSFDLENFSESLQGSAPQWKKESAVRSVEEKPVRGGVVHTNTDHSALKSLPLECILSQAEEISGRSNEDFLVENDPFTGFVMARPLRAFGALMLSAKSSDFPEWAWRKFLDSIDKETNRPRLNKLLARRMVLFSDDALLSIIRPVSGWFLRVASELTSSDVETFDKFFLRLLYVLKLNPDAAKSAIVRGRDEPDWVMEAINSPVGKLAQAIFEDERHTASCREQAFPATWLRNVEALVALHGDARRYVLTILSHNLPWFYSISPSWAEKNLIAALEGQDSQDQYAVLSGLLWRADVPSMDLYRRLKKVFLDFSTKNISVRRSHHDILAGIVLAGWGTIDEKCEERLITSQEMRDLLIRVSEDFRLRVLWQASNWGTMDNARGWESQVPKLIEEAWPQQISIRTMEVSAALLNLMFARKDWFSRLALKIAGLVTTVTDAQYISGFVDIDQEILGEYPREVLTVLGKVLGENAGNWPYGVGTVLEEICKLDSSISKDPLMINLTRIWNSR